MAEYQKIINVPSNLDKEKHDFFYYNPELRYFPVIDKLVLDVGPQVASNVMWAIYMAEDPSSKFYTTQPAQRRKYVEDVFLKIPGFEWSLYQYVIDFYPELVMGQGTKDYYRLRRRYDRHLDDVDSNVDFDKTTNFFKGLKMVYEGLNTARAEMEKEYSIAHGQNKGKTSSGKGVQ